MDTFKKPVFLERQSALDKNVYVMEKELSGPSFGRLCFISVKSDAYMTYRSVCKLDSNIEGNNLTSWV